MTKNDRNPKLVCCRGPQTRQTKRRGSSAALERGPACGSRAKFAQLRDTKHNTPLRHAAQSPGAQNCPIQDQTASPDGGESASKPWRGRKQTMEAFLTYLKLSSTDRFKCCGRMSVKEEEGKNGRERSGSRRWEGTLAAARDEVEGGAGFVVGGVIRSWVEGTPLVLVVVKPSLSHGRTLFPQQIASSLF